MSIINYGKKLIKDGFLVCESQLTIPHDFYKIWAPDFMESVVFVKTSKEKYQSSLHFFWVTVFHEREINNLENAEEIFSTTHLIKVTNEEAKEKIKQCCLSWYEKNHDLIPEAIWVHITWNDDNDVFILFEDDNYYYGWGWDVLE